MATRDTRESPANKAPINYWSLGCVLFIVASIVAAVAAFISADTNPRAVLLMMAGVASAILAVAFAILTLADGRPQ